MAFRFLSNTPIEEARAAYLDALREAGLAADAETIPTASSLGRVTSAPVYAAICSPHYPACAMDGIAVSARSTFGASETRPRELAKGEYVVVDTGDPLPDGMDAVIMAEDIVTRDDGAVVLHAPATPWQHVRQIGEDICAGEMVITSHERVTPAAIGSMLAGGVMELSVMRRPRVAVIPTGDEIVPPSSDPKPGDIIEFNSSIFSAMLAEMGAEAVVFPIVRDVRDDIERTVKEALATCDIVLLNAGSSAGRDDYTVDVASKVGRVLCHGIAIKPGKPAVLALCGAKPLVGVPGYPVSGIIIMEQIVQPIIDMWYCRAAEEHDVMDACVSRAVVSGLKYREYLRVRLGNAGGRTTATPLLRGAGVVSSFMKADGIVEIPQGLEGVEAGESVKVRLTRKRGRIESTLVMIGSHDPLLDEAADILHSMSPSSYMSSAHVGSMGGLMAIRRGEAHAAGTHLLDDETGEYNVSYIKKHFPNGGVRLVECVGRTQGIMIAAGDPLGIKGIEDIAREDVRYVNRQKGSGTRLLLDWLLKRAGISGGDVFGYDREELTHTSVAAQIASGTADAGMGIWSAAKMYGLGFVPICTEQYDLLIPNSAWDDPRLQALLEVLASAEMRRRLDCLGGYTVDAPGRVRAEF